MSFSNPTFPEWIDARGELPDSDIQVLGVVVLRKTETIDRVYHSGDCWRLADTDEPIIVIYWMPLPPTPAEKRIESLIRRGQ
jgi:hypothetical protein